MNRHLRCALQMLAALALGLLASGWAQAQDALVATQAFPAANDTPGWLLGLVQSGGMPGALVTVAWMLRSWTPTIRLELPEPPWLERLLERVARRWASTGDISRRDSRDPSDP